MGLKRGARVVGNAQPFQPEFGGGFGHGFQGILAVAGDGVVMETAANFVTGEEIR